LKIPATQGVISVHGNQKDARNIEQGFAPSHRNVNCLQDGKTEDNTNITGKQNKGSFKCRPMEQECEIKTVPLDPRVPDCHIPKLSFQNVNHFSHKKLKISKRIHLF
jgi:hypothetical protein